MIFLLFTGIFFQRIWTSFLFLSKNLPWEYVWENALIFFQIDPRSIGENSFWTRTSEEKLLNSKALDQLKVHFQYKFMIFPASLF